MIFPNGKLDCNNMHIRVCNVVIALVGMRSECDVSATTENLEKMMSRNDQPADEEAIQASKNKLNRKMEGGALIAQFVLKAFAVVNVIAVVAGGALMFLYQLRYNFNAGAFSAGDTLGFVWFILGFLITLFIGLGFGTLAGFPLMRLLHKVAVAGLAIFKRIRRQVGVGQADRWLEDGAPNRLQWEKKQKTMLVAGTVTLLWFGLFIFKMNAQFRIFLIAILAAGMWLSIFVFGELIKNHDRNDDRGPPAKSAHPLGVWFGGLPSKTRNRIVATVVALASQFVFFGYWQDASALAAGFRKQDVSVRLTREDFDSALYQATGKGIVVNSCEQIIPNLTVLHHADILWQNLGSKSLLRFPTVPLGGEESGTVRLELNNSSHNVFGSSSRMPCAEFLSDLLFKEEGSELRTSALPQLASQLSWLQELPSGWFIKVVAHSNADGGEGRKPVETLQQAQALKSHLAKTFGLAPDRVLAVGAEAKFPKQDCTNSGSQRDLCLKIGRRVEVYFVNPD
ncbi:hypothetical protein [Massilia horti]|nr:hypothetical protein [Massilia horti]